MYILPAVPGGGADADNGVGPLVTFVHSFIVYRRVAVAAAGVRC
jgi:hypothetical protein